MIVYHGSTVIVDKPQIIITEYGRDFGVGFYTTDIWDQAVRWALRKTKIAVLKDHNAQAIVSKYEFDEKSFKILKTIHFPEPSAAWLEMVCACRRNIQYNHGYDIITGKIANDNVGETVLFVVQGIMRAEDAIERLKFEKINNQICFSSEKALSYLKYTGFEEV
ncbi:hypothetical protein AGMMS49942_28660 [Spirochaetia bacterium]|nr:hypothetical protein AGMMS49942_28660 [Spirochaetia bacterium]